jgi:peptide/nickel transport system permease protein
MIPTFGVTFIAFAIMLLAPGDPVDLYFAGGLAAGAKGASSEKLADVARAKEAERKRLGLDRPVPVQYALWLGRLARLDLGESFKDKRPVWDKIRERLPVTSR